MHAQHFKNSNFELILDSNGRILKLSCLRSEKWKEIAFRSDQYIGPSFIIKSKGAAKTISLLNNDNNFSSQTDNLHISLSYRLELSSLAIEISITNNDKNEFRPDSLSLQLGIDTAQVKYPEWRQIYFPTLLRCEKTHFWGYFMNPNGEILAIGSPDPIASWHHNYNNNGKYNGGGTAPIFTSSIDLLHCAPLPSRHPENSDSIQSGQTKRWTIHLSPVDSLSLVKSSLAKIISAPMIDSPRYTYETDRPIEFTVIGSSDFTIEAPCAYSLGSKTDDRQVVMLQPPPKPHSFTIRCIAKNGRTAEANFSIRHKWSWYLKRAREEALRQPQKATTHIESYMGFYSLFLSSLHFPDSHLDNLADTKFAEVLPLLCNQSTGEFKAEALPHRIQNIAGLAAILAAKYRAQGNIADIELAAKLADAVIATQSADGAYRNNKTHYTCVIYNAKSIMEVMEEEKKLVNTDPAWNDRYNRHAQSVEKAIDELQRNLDNIETEGMVTFEDGMISCSYTQLALFALYRSNDSDVRKYIDAALFMKDGHRSLSQLLIPDSRQSGGSLRYWETQYDVLLTPNMLNSPHGWSAWRIYGLWYLYQLTGEWEYLNDYQNALGSCVQLIDADSGTLRWGFVPDPYIEATVFEECKDSPGKGKRVSKVIGESYIPMISDWYQAPLNKLVHGYRGDEGGCCDNDVHEIFKCLEETALTSAYVYEHPDKSITTWNCSHEWKENTLYIRPSEHCVKRVHLNLHSEINISFAGENAMSNKFTSMQWVNLKY